MVNIYLEMLKNRHFQKYSAVILQAPILLLVGIILTIFTLTYLKWIPSQIALVLSFLLFLLSFYYGRFLISGILIAICATHFIHLPYQHSFQNCVFQGTVNAISSKTTHIDAKNISCTNKTLPNQTILYQHYQKSIPLIAGKNYQFTADLSPISSYYNYHDFNYAHYQYLQQVLLKTNQVKAKLLKNQPIFSFAKWRANLEHIFKQHLSTNNAAIINALTIGKRSDINSDIRDQLQQTGTNHILAISGLHLTIIGGWSFIIFQILFASLPRKIQFTSPILFAAAMALITITIYALLSGFLLPVKRAWVMMSLLLVSWIFIKKINLNSLFIAMAFVLLVDPLAIYQVSFYFSFIATFVVLKVLQKKLNFIYKVLLIQIIISITLVPITWKVFGQISLISIPSNLIIIPWISLWVVPSTFLALFCHFLIPFIESIFWSLTNFTTTALRLCLQTFASPSYLFTPSFIPHLANVIASIILMLYAITTLNKKSIIYFVFAIIALIIPIKITKPKIILADSKQTSVLIHNQQDAILIDPGRKYKRIDAAQKWIHYLKINRLNLKAIILTNTQLSKISATSSLIKTYPSAQIVTLKPFDFPYQTNFCQLDNLNTKNIQIILSPYKNHCTLQINWFNHFISFKKETHSKSGIIIYQSKLMIQDQIYDTRQIGAIQLNPSLKITSLKKGHEY